jgi:hypothetical protein
MTLDFIENTLPHDKTQKVVVVMDTGEVHNLSFGVDMKRSQIVKMIPTLIGDGRRKVKRGKKSSGS